MTLPYNISDEQPMRRWRAQNTELLLKLGDVLYRLSGGYAVETLNLEQPGREQLLQQLKAVEEEMSKVKGVASFHHSLFYGHTRKAETNQTCIRILAYMVFSTLFRETPSVNIMTLAQIVVPDTELINAMEARRVASELVIQGALKLKTQDYGQSHPLTPYVRLNKNVLIHIMGSEKCMALLNNKTVEAVREERQDKMLDTIARNKELKQSLIPTIKKPVHLQPDKFRRWKQQTA